MNSLVAKRMDKGSFLFESSTSESIFAEIEEEFGEIEYGKAKFSDIEIYWIGYIYIDIGVTPLRKQVNRSIV